MSLLHILSTDVQLIRALGTLDPRWHARGLQHLTELETLPVGSLALIDTAHPDCPAWTDPRWRIWCGHLSIIIASSTPSDAEGIQAMEAGASGYCHAYANTATLRQVLDVVASGELWVGRSLLNRLLRGVGERLPPASEPGWRHGLTDREAEVALLAANGESNLAIANRLGITERTVKAHLTTVFDKLQLSDRLQLALRVHGIK